MTRAIYGSTSAWREMNALVEAVFADTLSIEPKEMEDPYRARERDVRVHRGVLQSQTKALVVGVSNAHRLRSRPPQTVHIRLKLATRTGN